MVNIFETMAHFCIHIETLAREKNLTHLEALTLFCEENDVSYDRVNDLLSESLKEKIYNDARKVYSMPKRTTESMDL